MCLVHITMRKMLCWNRECIRNRCGIWDDGEFWRLDWVECGWEDQTFFSGEGRKQVWAWPRSEISPGTTHLTCLFYGFGETDFSELNIIYCLWSKYPISIRNLAYVQTCMLPSVSYFKYKCIMTMKQTSYLQVFNDHCNKTYSSGFLLISIFQMTFHGGLFQGIFFIHIPQSSLL